MQMRRPSSTEIRTVSDIFLSHASFFVSGLVRISKDRRDLWSTSLHNSVYARRNSVPFDFLSPTDSALSQQIHSVRGVWTMAGRNRIRLCFAFFCLWLPKKKDIERLGRKNSRLFDVEAGGVGGGESCRFLIIVKV